MCEECCRIVEDFVTKRLRDLETKRFGNRVTGRIGDREIKVIGVYKLYSAAFAFSALKIHSPDNISIRKK
jgi:hypothetical protein